MKVAFLSNVSDIVSGSIDAFTASAEASGRGHGEQTMRQLLKYSGTISEGMGNAVAGNRRPVGWPVILEVLERIEFDHTIQASDVAKMPGLDNFESGLFDMWQRKEVVWPGSCSE
jgi:hypothetical protein